VLKITVLLALMTSALITNEALKIAGYELAGLLAFCGFLIISWLFAIQEEGN
jgi:hypothetical protein